VAELVNALPERRVTLTFRALPPAEGDRVMLRQVLTNLISNALKFTGPRQPPMNEIGSLANREEITYYIRDNGVGFDMAYASKLFRVFQRLHRAEDFEGTGIDLALVQSIIQRHGGRVWAEGKVGEGATFYFALKRAVEHEAQRASARAGGTPP